MGNYSVEVKYSRVVGVVILFSFINSIFWATFFGRLNDYGLISWYFFALIFMVSYVWFIIYGYYFGVSESGWYRFCVFSSMMSVMMSILVILFFDAYIGSVLRVAAVLFIIFGGIFFSELNPFRKNRSHEGKAGGFLTLAIISFSFIASVFLDHVLLVGATFFGLGFFVLMIHCKNKSR